MKWWGKIKQKPFSIHYRFFFPNNIPMWNRVDRFVWTCLTRGEQHQPILIKRSVFSSSPFLIRSICRCLGASVKFDNNSSSDNYNHGPIDSILYLNIEITCQLCNVNIECIEWARKMSNTRTTTTTTTAKSVHKNISITSLTQREWVSRAPHEPHELVSLNHIISERQR